MCLCWTFYWLQVALFNAMTNAIVKAMWERQRKLVSYTATTGLC